MKKILKGFGIFLVIILGIIILLAGFLFTNASYRMNKVYAFQPEKVVFPTDATSIERGDRLASIYCAECHGENFGGKTIFSKTPLGVIIAPNLTMGMGGAGSEFKDANWILAVRHGVNPEGKPLIVMPSKDRYYLSDTDFGAIIAYIKSLPPVDKKWDEPKFTPLGKILIAAGAFGNIIDVETIDHSDPRPVAPVESVSVDYGEYLVKSFGCTTCHGKDYAGGKDPNPDAPPAPDLTQGGDLSKWTDLVFIKTIRTGVNPSQHKLTEFMPWKSLGQMTDDELKAVWLYLKSLPVSPK